MLKTYRKINVQIFFERNRSALYQLMIERIHINSWISVLNLNDGRIIMNIWMLCKYNHDSI